MRLSSLVINEFHFDSPSNCRDEDAGVGGDQFRFDESRSDSRVLREIARLSLLFIELA
jgi:hypothetical protein